MACPVGEAELEPLRVDFDRRLKLEFHASDISSDGGLLPDRELDHALGLTNPGGEVLSETRRGKNARHLLAGLLRQSVFGRLGGYEDVNDAQRLSGTIPSCAPSSTVRASIGGPPRPSRCEGSRRNGQLPIATLLR